jgi:hypothetical protein
MSKFKETFNKKKMNRVASCLNAIMLPNDTQNDTQIQGFYLISLTNNIRFKRGDKNLYTIPGGG